MHRLTFPLGVVTHAVSVKTWAPHTHHQMDHGAVEEGRHLVDEPGEP